MLGEVLAIALDLGASNPGGTYEIRPLFYFRLGRSRHDRWRVDRRRTENRSPAPAALLRNFGSSISPTRLSRRSAYATEDVSAPLKAWPANGTPRDARERRARMRTSERHTRTTTASCFH
jgi:hypothetical protein